MWLAHVAIILGSFGFLFGPVLLGLLLALDFFVVGLKPDGHACPTMGDPVTLGVLSVFWKARKRMVLDIDSISLPPWSTGLLEYRQWILFCPGVPLWRV